MEASLACPCQQLKPERMLATQGMRQTKDWEECLEVEAEILEESRSPSAGSWQGPAHCLRQHHSATAHHLPSEVYFPALGVAVAGYLPDRAPSPSAARESRGAAPPPFSVPSSPFLAEQVDGALGFPVLASQEVSPFPLVSADVSQNLRLPCGVSRRALESEPFHGHAGCVLAAGHAALPGGQSAEVFPAFGGQVSNGLVAEDVPGVHG